MTHRVKYTFLASLLVATTCVWSSKSAEARPRLVFHGNEALIAPVLELHVDLPEGTSATQAGANKVSRSLRRFFRMAGYDLADIRAVAKGGALHVFIDEGKLERVVFHGHSSYRTLQLKLGLMLPAQVFNRPQVESELKRLEELHGIKKLRYKVVSSGAEDGTGIQLGDLDKLPIELLWTREARRFELHVFAENGGWGEGLGAGIVYEQPDGVRGHLSWAGNGLLFGDDRLKLDTWLAAWSREPLDGGRERPRLTRAEQRLRWMTPAIIGRWLRATLRATALAKDTYRSDLLIDIAWRYRLSAGMDLYIEPWKPFSLDFGGGYRFDGVGGVQVADSRLDIPGAGPVSGDQRKVPYVRAGLALTFSADSLRLDKSHKLRVEALDLGVFEPGHVLDITMSYRKVFEIGWDDLFFRVYGAWVEGDDTRWWDEISTTSTAFRFAPSDVTYARRIGQGSLEYRLSLHRDYFKVGAFLGGSYHGYTTTLTGFSRAYTPAGTGGLSLHFLVMDAFQFDAYFGGSLDKELEFSPGAGFYFQKVY